MRLGSLVCGLLISIIYLMDFLYLQRGLQSRPWCEILYIRCTHIMRVLFGVFCLSIHRRSPPPPPYTLQTIVLLLLLFTSSIFKDTLYFLLKYVLPPVLFTLTQVVLLLIIYIKILLDCDWLISVQLIPNSSAIFCSHSAIVCNHSAIFCNHNAKICNKLIWWVEKHCDD
jgi:hypothetical protein